MDTIHSLLPLDAQFGPLLDGRLVDLMSVVGIVLPPVAIVVVAWWLLRLRRVERAKH